jgi:hypothetical protein
VKATVLFSEHLIGDGQQMFEHAAKLNWEGIISKRADAPYRFATRTGNEELLHSFSAIRSGFGIIGKRVPFVLDRLTLLVEPVMEENADLPHRITSQ